MQFDKFGQDAPFFPAGLKHTIGILMFMNNRSVLKRRHNKQYNPICNDTPDMKRLPFASFRSLFCPGAFSPCPAQDKTQFSIHGTGGLRTAGFLGRRNSHCLPMVGMVINLRFPVIKGGARVYPQYKESIDPGTYSRGLSHRFKTFPDWWIVLNHSLIRCFVLEGLSYY